MADCKVCSRPILGTVRNPKVHMSKGVFHYNCLNPSAGRAGDEEEELPPEALNPDPEEETEGVRSENSDSETPAPRENKNDFYGRGKMIYTEELVPLPLRSVPKKHDVPPPKPATPKAYILVELKNGVPTGWTHRYLTKESADKKAYFLNLNGGALSYRVEAESVASPAKPEAPGADILHAHG